MKHILKVTKPTLEPPTMIGENNFDADDDLNDPDGVCVASKKTKKPPHPEKCQMKLSNESCNDVFGSVET